MSKTQTKREKEIARRKAVKRRIFTGAPMSAVARSAQFRKHGLDEPLPKEEKEKPKKKKRPILRKISERINPFTLSRVIKFKR